MAASSADIGAGRGGADIGVPLNYSSTIESSAGKGWGRHWGAFKLL